MAAIKQISVSRKKLRDQNLKNHFPKEISHIWLQVEEHEYIYIFEIMPIYANQRENGAADIFFTKRCVTDSQAITKKSRKYLRVLTGDGKNVTKSWVQVDPLCTYVLNILTSRSANYNILPLNCDHTLPIAVRVMSTMSYVITCFPQLSSIKYS